MKEVVIRANEACTAADPFLLWDSVWDPAKGFADWRLAVAGEVGNAGGLSAVAAIETAVTLALFTDRRAPLDHPLSYLADGDVRGWWGDAVDVQADRGEAALGSWLWLLERAPLTVAGQPVTRWAETFALDALAPLQTVGAVVRIDVSAVANETANRLELTVRLYGRDNALAYDRKFDLLWTQVGR